MALLILGKDGGSGFEHAQTTPTIDVVLAPFAGVLAIVGLICLNALFVAGETAVEQLKAIHVKFLRETNATAADRLQVLFDGQERFANAAWLGTQLSRVLLVVACFLTSPHAVRLLGWEPTMGYLLLATLVILAPVGILDLVFGELIPKSFATLHPPRVALLLRGLLRTSSVLFALPLVLVTGVAKFFAARFGGRVNFGIQNAAEEEIRTIVETAESIGEIEFEEKELLHSVFEFTDTIAREVMTPRVDLDAMPVRSDPTEVMRVVQESGHSRIPLYEDTDDQIVGIIHAKDLLMAVVHGKAPNLRTLMRPVVFVPENKNLHDLLKELRSHRTQMAIVQDEYGGTAGIVTIEDIVEELVGDIVDEYDQEEPEIQEIEGGWLVDGKAHVDDVNYRIGSKFQSEDYDTIGGFVFGLFGRQPKVGESIESNDFKFVVADTDGRRVAKLRIEKVSESLFELEPGELV